MKSWKKEKHEQKIKKSNNKKKLKSHAAWIYLLRVSVNLVSVKTLALKHFMLTAVYFILRRLLAEYIASIYHFYSSSTSFLYLSLPHALPSN